MCLGTGLAKVVVVGGNLHGMLKGEERGLKQLLGAEAEQQLRLEASLLKAGFSAAGSVCRASSTK